MDGVHDLGGTQGFGPVVRTPGEKVYEYEWELKSHAIQSLLLGLRKWNMDEQRHAIERMEPRHYMAASYFERVLTATATLMVEKGISTSAELNTLAGGRFPLSRPNGAGRMPALPARKFSVGDRVRLKNEFVGGHVRMPAYLRGKTGTVVSVAPAVAFPDAAAHGLQAPPEETYDIRFASHDLWPDASDNAWVHAAIFRSYLELEESAAA